MNTTNWYDVLRIIITLGIVIAFFQWMLFDWNKATKKLFDTLPDFKADAFHLGGKKSISFAIDKERKKICFVKKLKPVFYDFNQIYKCGSFVHTYYERDSKTGSFTGTAKVGGERVKVSGSVSVPGDLYQMCEKMGLEITLINEVLYTVLFISEPTFVNSDTYKEAYDLCLEWDSFFDSHAIEKHKTDSNNRTVSLTFDGSSSPFASKLVSGITTPASTPSVADEILKIKNLLDQGALTQEEFEVQKAKLLNG